MLGLYTVKLDREAQAVDMFVRLKSILETRRSRAALDLKQESPAHLVASCVNGRGHYDLVQIDRIGRIVAFQLKPSSGIAGLGLELYFEALSADVRYFEVGSRHIVRITAGIRPSRGATTTEIMEQLSFVDPTIAPYFAGTGGFIRYTGRRKGTLEFEFIGPTLLRMPPENVTSSLCTFPSPGIVPRKTITQMFGKNGYFFPGEDSQGRS